MLGFARQAVARKVGAETSAPAPCPPALAARRLGLFVTVYKKGELRGSAGHPLPEKSLPEAVAETACAAAFDDARFLPLQPDEFPDLRFEISLLSPPERLLSIEDLRPGVHGVWLRRGARSGVLLPQIWETLKDRALVLNELCAEKAGLEERCWQDPAVELYTFTTEVIAE